MHDFCVIVDFYAPIIVTIFGSYMYIHDCVNAHVSIAILRSVEMVEVVCAHI